MKAKSDKIHMYLKLSLIAVFLLILYSSFWWYIIKKLYISKAEFEDIQLKFRELEKALHFQSNHGLTSKSMQLTAQTHQLKKRSLNNNNIDYGEKISELSRTIGSLRREMFSLNSRLRIILSYDHGLFSRISRIPGKMGPPGKPGPPGRPGDDGRDGYHGTQGTPGPPGPVGASGKDGGPGRDGKPGVNGIPGIPGINGQKGNKGERGNHGRDGFDGGIGLTGRPGIPGIRGPRGYKGEPGVCTKSTTAANTIYPSPPADITSHRKHGIYKIWGASRCLDQAVIYSGQLAMSKFTAINGTTIGGNPLCIPVSNRSKYRRKRRIRSISDSISDSNTVKSKISVDPQKLNISKAPQQGRKQNSSHENSLVDVLTSIQNNISKINTRTPETNTQKNQIITTRATITKNSQMVQKNTSTVDSNSFGSSTSKPDILMTGLNSSDSRNSNEKSTDKEKLKAYTASLDLTPANNIFSTKPHTTSVIDSNNYKTNTADEDQSTPEIQVETVAEEKKLEEELQPTIIPEVEEEEYFDVDFDYSTPNYAYLESTRKYVSCAVCETETESSTMMIPSQSECPDTWSIAYTGYLMTYHHESLHSEALCVYDQAFGISPHSSNGIRSIVSKYLSHIKKDCNSFSCSPDDNEKLVRCVVCIK